MPRKMEEPRINTAAEQNGHEIVGESFDDKSADIPQLRIKQPQNDLRLCLFIFVLLHF